MTPRSRLKILFDHNTPSPLRRYLHEHDVDTANEKGWAGIANGELIRLATEQGYDILITADQNISHQQNTRQSSIGIVVLLSKPVAIGEEPHRHHHPRRSRRPLRRNGTRLNLSETVAAKTRLPARLQRHR